MPKYWGKQIFSLGRFPASTQHRRFSAVGGFRTTTRSKCRTTYPRTLERPGLGSVFSLGTLRDASPAPSCPNCWPVPSVPCCSTLPLSLIRLLLILGGVEPNPGPCTVCNKNVGAPSYLCGACGSWIHGRCSQISRASDYPGPDA